MTRTEDRLAGIEAALPPLAATVVWLEEALTFPSPAAYGAWLLEQPGLAGPLDRVPAQACANASLVHRGEPWGAVFSACRVAERDSVSLVVLVLELNAAAQRTIEIGTLRLGWLAADLRALRLESQLDERRSSSPGRTRGRSISDRWHAWARHVESHLTETYALEAARLQLERQFLAGHATLFAEVATAVEKLRVDSESLADAGISILDGASNRTLARRLMAELNVDALRAAGRAQAPGRAAKLLASVRIEALQLSGEFSAARAEARNFVDV
jgi:hypothetical protein